MYKFKYYYGNKCKKSSNISIQPMYKFKPMLQNNTMPTFEFQYNQCISSSWQQCQKAQMPLFDFNTTNV